jgi:hypothetical protein
MAAQRSRRGVLTIAPIPRICQYNHGIVTSAIPGLIEEDMAPVGPKASPGNLKLDILDLLAELHDCARMRDSHAVKYL